MYSLRWPLRSREEKLDSHACSSSSSLNRFVTQSSSLSVHKISVDGQNEEPDYSLPALEEEPFSPSVPLPLSFSIILTRVSDDSQCKELSPIIKESQFPT